MGGGWLVFSSESYIFLDREAFFLLSQNIKKQEIYLKNINLEQIDLYFSFILE